MEPKIVEGKPLIEWLILRGSVTVLKQFTTVSLTVQNLADEPFKLSKGSATLSLPEGLSLAPTAKAQAYSQPVPEIPGRGSATSTWVVRGDVPGLYTMAADYKAQLEPFEAPVDIPAALREPFHVWGAEAFTLKVKADSGKLEPGQPYHVTVGLTNKADIPFYNVKLAIDPKTHANFIFQPDERFSDSTGDPGADAAGTSTSWRRTPKAWACSTRRSRARPSTAKKSTPAKKSKKKHHPRCTRSPRPATANNACTCTGKRCPAPKATRSFRRRTSTRRSTKLRCARRAPSVGTLSSTPLPAAATDAYVAGTHGAKRYFAVSALIGGHPTLESDVILASSPGGLATPAAKTGPARAVTLDTALLTATVNPEGEEVEECVFEYGLTAAYGSVAPCSPQPGSGNGAVAVSAALSELQPNATYHFRVFAGSALGYGAGADETFTTLETSTTGSTTNAGVPAKATDGALSVEASEGTGKVTIGPYGSDIGGVPLASASGAYFQVYRSVGSTFKKMEYADCELHGARSIWWDNPATGWGPISEPTAIYTESPTPCITVKASEATTPALPSCLTHGTSVDRPAIRNTGNASLPRRPTSATPAVRRKSSAKRRGPGRGSTPASSNGMRPRSNVSPSSTANTATKVAPTSMKRRARARATTKPVRTRSPVQADTFRSKRAACRRSGARRAARRMCSVRRNRGPRRSPSRNASSRTRQNARAKVRPPARSPRWRLKRTHSKKAATTRYSQECRSWPSPATTAATR